MNRFKSSAHAVYELKYHFVWAPKYRKRILSLFQDELGDIFFQIAEEYDFQIIEMGIMPDHIHILLSAPPRFSPARIVNILKSISARELFKRYPHLEEVCWSRKIWEDGYFVRAVGEKVSSQIIQEYIRYQRESRVRQPLLFDSPTDGEP